MKIQAISGQREFGKLTNKLSGETYAICKSNIWINMLNDGEKPTRWLKATAKGTKVNFDFIKQQEQYDAGLIELEKYLLEINQEYGLDFQLVK